MPATKQGEKIQTRASSALGGT